MNKIGFALIAIGIAMADSEYPVVPTAVVALGFFILWRNGYVG